MPPGLVIFDCDGTLVDSETLGNAVLVEVVAEHGLTLSVADALRAFRGARMADCVAELERRLGRALPPGFVPELRRRMADVFTTSLRAMPGAIEVVRGLSGPRCVASSGPRQKIELSLTVTGLSSYFPQNHIFSSYEVGVWKPDPEMFRHVARAMGVPAGDCVVVEDSLPGIVGGVAAGMRVVALQPHGREDGVPDGVVVIESLDELPAIVDGWRGAAATW